MPPEQQMVQIQKTGLLVHADSQGFLRWECAPLKRLVAHMGARLLLQLTELNDAMRKL